MATGKLLTLPVERSCRKLFAIIEQSQLLHYHIRTMGDHMEDVSYGDVSYSDFLKTLNRWERAWDNLNLPRERLKANLRASTHFGWSTTYFLQCGYLVAMRPSFSPSFGWSYVDLPRSFTNPKMVLQRSDWTCIVADGNPRITSCAIDIQQDLVVAAVQCPKGIEIRFLTFTTGNPHSLAGGAVIQFKMSFKPSCEVRMSIMGRHVAVIVNDRSSGMTLARRQRVYLLDWMKGHVCCVRRAPRHTLYSVLSFLSEDLVLIARQRGFALEICKIESRHGKEATHFLKTLCILKLPGLHQKAWAWLKMVSRPPLSSSSSSSPPRKSQLPFRSSTNDVILGFDLFVSRSDMKTYHPSMVQEFAFWVHSSTLCSFADQSEIAARGQTASRRGLASFLRHPMRHSHEPPLIKEWVEWGPSTTRWFSTPTSSAIPAAWGTRCALLTRHYVPKLLDFNKGRVSRKIAHRDASRSSANVVTAPTTIKEDTCFLQDVISSLPYCETSAGGLDPQVLMDDEWVVHIKVSV
ncbi:hypothetical protein BC834DRAFT_876682 [Gloeopeniophorella convolvens]|nr:hypothetical protein BC834DRAFT_876682 [Gloeopeniophorella convolvens]